MNEIQKFGNLKHAVLSICVLPLVDFALFLVNNYFITFCEIWERFCENISHHQLTRSTSTLPVLATFVSYLRHYIYDVVATLEQVCSVVRRPSEIEINRKQTYFII